MLHYHHSYDPLAGFDALNRNIAWAFDAEFQKMANATLDAIVSCDNKNDKPLHRLSDAQVKELIVQHSGTANTSSFQHLDRLRQTEIIRILRSQGASIRQLERLTGLSRGLIFRM